MILLSFMGLILLPFGIIPGLLCWVLVIWISKGNKRKDLIIINNSIAVEPREKAVEEKVKPKELPIKSERKHV